MELYTLILTLTIVLSTDAELEHEAYQFSVCSNSEGEFFLGYDEEELWHANFNLNTGIVTTPNFTGPMTFAGFYDRALEFLAACKRNILSNINGFKNPPPEMEGMRLSQYRPKKDGTFNIFSTLKFTPAEGDVYSCTVNHRALKGQRQTKIWDVDVVLPSVIPAVFCGVAMTLGLVGVAAGTFFFIKGKNCN
ncbi:HLA class II histocompatibility DP alpha 1 chain-like protein [Labeo rohita]|uniref:HLA class II histocompatibility DP alpha 1 chain-like protein n=1 Tax=Labeo rohita TaxID=84645 RepID=A0A498NZP9_LABRO|nr:HLA class II histocompatibility DP alpha 1 chain-like protein [Labeo rohita]